MTTLSSVSYAGRLGPVLATAEVLVSPEVPKPDRKGLLFWVTMAFVAVGVLARVVRYFVNGAMWGDECAVGSNIVQRDFEGLTHLLDYLQTAPILFLWGERVVYLTLGSSELAMRLLPFLASMAALFVFWDFARRAASPLAAAFAVGILAVARWPVYMGATLKPYSFDLLAAVVLLNLALRWWLKPDKLWPLVALACVIPFVLGSSYPAVFVAGAVSLYLLPTAWRHPRWQAKVAYVAYNTLMLGAFLANYQLHIQQQIEEKGRFLEIYMREYWADGFPPASPLAFVKWAAEINTGRMFAYPLGDANGGSAATLVVFLIGVAAAWRTRQRWLLVLALTPFALNFLAAAIGKYPYGACCRLSQHVAPAICLFTALGLAAIFERCSRRAILLTALVLVGVGVGQVAVDLASPNRDAVCVWSRQIKRELVRHLKPGDQVVVASPRFMMDMTTDWQLARLGERVSWGKPAPNEADAPRVWMVLNTAAGSKDTYEHDVKAMLTPGRVEIGRVRYSIPPDKDLNVNWHCQLICLAKPECTSETPVFRSSP